MKRQINLSSIFAEYGRKYCNDNNADAEFINASDIGVSYFDMSIHCNRFHKWNTSEYESISKNIIQLNMEGINVVDDLPHHKISFI